MSSVILQVGQCGNQIGDEFWKLVLENKQENERGGQVYCHGDGYLRSINVDSEPKVVRRVITSQSKSQFRDCNVIVGRRGRGTNWALGYHGFQGREDKLTTHTMEAVRKETERCDSFSGIIMMHSMSGGTGSGLGSRLCESLRDQFPLHYLTTCVVAPHQSGESPLQHYNALLCLDSLQRHCDNIILFPNDEILYRLKKAARGKAAESSISFSMMNEHIAACLCGVFLPIETITPSNGVSIGMEPWEMLRNVTPMPSVKFSKINTLSRSKLSWKNLAGHLVHTVKRYDDSGQPYTSLANLVVARGDTVGDFPLHQPVVEERMRSAYNCVPWNPFPIDFWTGKHNHVRPHESASLTVAANYSDVVEHLQTILKGAREKYEATAYLHWYWKHGCQQTDFEEAFETLQTVIEDYTEAVR